MPAKKYTDPASSLRTDSVDKFVENSDMKTLIRVEVVVDTDNTEINEIP